ncbi:conserved unknown protein [Ectocarpus siliculosus]|uniref:Major facilitator superfamily associated domain-containing protein n=1 Tax=Ectocarpus siliculosus TaxID=2880 RepID=D8LNX9_ECTSI|nr:conserved unknown protein [Ectocarpus siliculosus]|eukprot:CBN78339.1 conserved unknown protein [Ectocarpus siliculosus]
MLHKRRRRVAAHASRRTTGRYYQVVLLLLSLTTSSITAIAVSSSGEQRQHLRRSSAASGASGSGVGGAAQRISCNVWTAGKKVETLRRSHNFCSSEVATAGAAAAATSPTDGLLRERIGRSLLEVRGGSEGLKSEKWSREKAAAGMAARTGAGGNAGLQKATPVAGDAGIGVGVREGAAAAPGTAGIRVGGGEPQSAPVDQKTNRGGRDPAKGVGLASQDDVGMVLEVEEDRRSLETPPAAGGGGDVAASATSQDAGLVRDSVKTEAAAVGAAAAAAAPEGATARDQPSPAAGASAAGSTTVAVDLADSGVGGGSGGVDSSEVSGGEWGVGGQEDVLDLLSQRDVKGTTAVRKRRRTATPKVASGGWTRKPAPPEEPGATGIPAVTGSRPNDPPRAGAPRPPRGEVRVWRPWGRHGAVAASGAGVSDSGNVVEGTAAPGGGVAAAATGSEVVAVVGQEAAGGDEVVGKAKAKRMRWEPKYLTVKAVFFLFYSSLGAIMPYLPVYYHSLGIPDRRIGHLGAITPAMTFLFTPLWGALTDKSGMLKQILVLTFAASTLLRVSLAARTSFLWIVSVITLTAVINAPVRPLLDSSALQSLDDRAEYGKQRLWGQWGFGIGSFLTGKLLSRFGFKAAFYMHAAFSLPTLLILMRFSPKKEDRGKEPPKFGELYQLVVHDPDVLVFFSMVFAIGLSSGVIENFAYKRLRELGGTGSVLGVSRLVSSLSGIPMFFFSGAIVKHFSIVGILTASMMSFIARFVIYASIKNPWAGLPAEALRGVTFAGFWAASTCHVGAIAPPGLSTTMLGLLNATYGGIGQSLGSLIGGSLSMRFGTARAFLVYASVDACLLLAFFLFWGLHPNGQQKDRGAGGGIGASSGQDVGKVSPHAGQLPPPAEATPQQPAEGVQDQTFTPPPAVGQR